MVTGYTRHLKKLRRRSRLRASARIVRRKTGYSRSARKNYLPGNHPACTPPQIEIGILTGVVDLALDELVLIGPNGSADGYLGSQFVDLGFQNVELIALVLVQTEIAVDLGFVKTEHFPVDGLTIRETFVHHGDSGLPKGIRQINDILAFFLFYLIGRRSGRVIRTIASAEQITTFVGPQKTGQ